MERLQKIALFLLVVFMGLSCLYLFVGLFHIGFPKLSIGGFIKQLGSMFATLVSLIIAFLAFQIAKKSALASEESALAAKRSLFIVTFKDRIDIYSALCDLKDILDNLLKVQHYNTDDPYKHYLDSDVIEKVEKLSSILLYKSKILPSDLHLEIKGLFTKIKNDLRSQMRVDKNIYQPSNPPSEEKFTKWKKTNTQNNSQVIELIKKVESHVSTP
ncbi:hypothetical protein [Aliivibrio fischeri]|uniref:hypothetical protein n=1 Tax=Aliivibrio fischeri TaxID=668 RepID=UPI00105D7C1D|nr:hypothetical protein [Aliivibrio fischeri]TDM51382.1 hypothetical protein VFFQA001_14745 [Aliivibrio fischeri]